MVGGEERRCERIDELLFGVRGMGGVWSEDESLGEWLGGWVLGVG